MGRGKIEIKRIENPTNRQVTYSKRRNGIFKKAQELTVLCDAKVSLIMFSSSNKCHEYISPNITTKKIYDQYQKALGIDLWNSHYEEMQENLRKLKEINSRLRRQIRQRMGEDLEDLGMGELIDLHQEVAASLSTVTARKYHVIKNQTDTCKKKIKNLEEIYGTLLLEMESKYEDFGLVESERDYESAASFAHGAANLYAFSLHPHHPNIHPEDGFGSHDLRLG